MKASDFLKELENNPEYQEMRKRKNKELEAQRAIHRKDEEILIRDLMSVGLKVDSVWDLVNNKSNYSFLRKFEGEYDISYPILVKHLSQPHLPKIREGIIRALTEKNANEVASEALLNEFKSEKDKNIKWVLANALSTVLSRTQKRKHPQYREVLNENSKP